MLAACERRRGKVVILSPSQRLNLEARLFVCFHVIGFPWLKLKLTPSSYDLRSPGSFVNHRCGAGCVVLVKDGMKLHLESPSRANEFRDRAHFGSCALHFRWNRSSNLNYVRTKREYVLSMRCVQNRLLRTLKVHCGAKQPQQTPQTADYL